MTDQIAAAAHQKPTVFVVDDDPAVCGAISAGITKVIGLPVQSYTSADAFLAEYDAKRPGCLVLDVKMPGMSGLELQEALRARGAHLPVIMISGHAEVRTAVKAMKNGALSLLEKPFDMQQLEEHIRQALKIDAGARDKAERREAISDRLAALTSREREIMGLLVEGKTNKEIALALGTSLPTVDKHRWKVFEKMRVDNVVELFRLMSELAE
ncbi:MAG TPA: response regulator [Pirellulales bacterium]|jgi:FixJ family two-component response regulator|nr:response regulator [Pirellulales bacterium]